VAVSLNVGGKAVPIIWRPSDLIGPDSDGHAGRSGHAIRAIVHHRVVGSLESMVNTTFKPTTDNELDKGERRVSSTFGIGFWTTAAGPELRIYQFVALEDTAYCNGQSPADRDACRWKLWIGLGRPPTNEITVSIEHEDNGKAGGYVVVEPIIEASIALDRLLLSGDAKAIRAAGIRCSDAAAAQLGRIVPSAQTLIDHKVIAPVSKPYCWRPIGKGKGFPQARYVAALTEETSMLHMTGSKIGTVTFEAGTRVIRVRGGQTTTFSANTTIRHVFAEGEWNGTAVWITDWEDEQYVIAKSRCEFTPVEPPPPVDCTAVEHRLGIANERLRRIDQLAEPV
jgi:hypothetical protein